MKEKNKLNDALSTVRSAWDAKANDETDALAKVDSGLRAQRMRFEMFVLYNELEGSSILDVGSGMGHFWNHLQSRNISYEYLGVDLSPAMVAQCSKRCPDATFETANILDWEPGRKFDFVTSFAIHNIVVDQGWEILKATTKQQFSLCNKATHLSLLTDRYDGFAPHIQAWKPEQVLEFALSLTPYVSLRHDYLPNDFSITLYHEPLIDTHPSLLLNDR